MWIYKITNIQNNKVYIGQTIRPIEQRFHRHINDAMNNILDTHFARAIRKYGKDSFIIEEIDTAQTQDELNQKEQYWIRYYDAVNKGYNETDAINKCGGNTYQSKTEEEMKIKCDDLEVELDDAVRNGPYAVLGDCPDHITRPPNPRYRPLHHPLIRNRPRPHHEDSRRCPLPSRRCCIPRKHQGSHPW